LEFLKLLECKRVLQFYFETVSPLSQNFSIPICAIYSNIIHIFIFYLNFKKKLKLKEITLVQNLFQQFQCSVIYYYTKIIM